MTITTYRPFTIEDYHKMAEAGVFAPDERVELLGGEVRPMSPVGKRHIQTVRRLNRVFIKSFGATHEIDIQNPVVLSEYSEPEPDAMVVRRPVSDDLMEKPTASDVFILVEVSDTTLIYDRDDKLPLYARAGVPEVWIIDVNHNVLTQYHTPRNGVYTRSAVYQHGDTIVTTLGVEILADDILL